MQELEQDFGGELLHIGQSHRWATICSITGKIGCTPETLRAWCKRLEASQASTTGKPSERERFKQLERENRNKGFRVLIHVAKQINGYYYRPLKKRDFFKYTSSNYMASILKHGLET